MATKALRFYRAADLPKTAGSAAPGDIYFIKPSPGNGQIYVCTAGTSSTAPTFVKYADATVYTHPNDYSNSPTTSTQTATHGGTVTVIDGITVNSKGHVTSYNTKTVTLPADNNTHYTTHLYAGSGTAANAATTNGNTKLTICDDTTVRNTVTVKGSGKASVTSDASGVITINAAAGTYEETPGSGSKTAATGSYIDGVSLSAGHVLDATTKSFVTNIASNGTSTTAPTTKAVKEYVDNAIASAIHIKGTIGSSGATITSLPTSAVVGDAYVVKTAGTYASQKCEVGDIIICTATTPTWTVVQNNLDVATADKLGTIKIGYTENGKNYPVELDSNNKAYVNVPWTDIPQVTANSSTPAQLAHSGNFTAVSSVTLDTSNRIIGYNLATYKLPDIYVHPSDGKNTGSFGPSANATLAHSGTFTVPYITVNSAGHVTAAATRTLTLPAGYTHPNDYSNSPTTSTATPSHGGTVTVIGGITVNAAGHVTTYDTKTITLPSQYVLPAATTTKLGGIKIGTSLEMSGEVCNVVWTDFGS